MRENNRSDVIIVNRINVMIVNVTVTVIVTVTGNIRLVILTIQIKILKFNNSPCPVQQLVSHPIVSKY